MLALKGDLVVTADVAKGLLIALSGVPLWLLLLLVVPEVLL